MAYTQALLTFPDQQHAELYVNDNSANPRFSVKANPTAADILPPNHCRIPTNCSQRWPTTSPPS